MALASFGVLAKKHKISSLAVSFHQAIDCLKIDAFDNG